MLYLLIEVEEPLLDTKKFEYLTLLFNLFSCVFHLFKKKIHVIHFFLVL